MPKTIHTPRDELVCGKLDTLREQAVAYKDVAMCYLIDDIRHDCERMETKLVSRKDEAAATEALREEVSNYAKESMKDKEQIEVLRERVLDMESALKNILFQLDSEAIDRIRISRCQILARAALKGKDSA